jgi:hypothetical protein
MLFSNLNIDWLCILAPYGESSEPYRILTKCSYFYLLLKITDLFDTVSGTFEVKFLNS